LRPFLAPFAAKILTSPESIERLDRKIRQRKAAEVAKKSANRQRLRRRDSPSGLAFVVRAKFCRERLPKSCGVLERIVSAIAQYTRSLREYSLRAFLNR
jgi:hypothetical protein